MTGCDDAGILVIMNASSSHTGRITEIRDQVRDPERVSLFVDGEFRIGAPRQVVAERNLHVGQVLTEDDLTELAVLDEISRARNAAVRLLSFRPRAQRELEIRLARKGFAPLAIERALERLAELGYVNDREFAEQWVENRAEHRPRGRRLIASELRSKGVARDIVDQVVDEAEIDEFSAALNLARTRSGRLKGLEPVVRKRRLVGFLQRRGYGWDVVRRVIDELDSDPDDAQS
jgi:regulatory protein